MSAHKKGDALLEQVLALPRTHEEIVPTDYLDYNGHMNVMYYTGVGNKGIASFFKILGLSPELFGSHQRGMFALRQVLSYMNEIRVGEHIAVHTGLVEVDSKRIHFFHYIVNLTHMKVASSDERVAMYMNMNERKSASWEPEIREKLEQARNYYKTLSWEPELSGAITLKRH